MNSKQENRHSMQLAVVNFLTQNTSITNTLPNFNTLFTSFQSIVSQIQTIREQQEIDKTGIAANKNQLKRILISQTMEIARRITAYATIVNNAVLLGEVWYSESDLSRSPDTILRDQCLVIYDRGIANISVLNPYGVTPAMLTALQNAINNFAAAIPKPRLGIMEKKLATGQLATLFASADDILEKMDVLVEMVKNTQGNFYNAYNGVRKVINTGMGSLAVKGLVMQAQNGKPLKGVKVTFRMDSASGNGNGTGNGNVLVKQTGEKGGFHIKSIDAGIYMVLLEKPGYVNQSISVPIADGELNRIEVVMMKV